MLRRHKLLILIPVMLLVPILLGMTPVNMAHRLASGASSTHCKQAQWTNHCLFHSLTSHGDPTIVNLNLTSMDYEATPTLDMHVLNPDSAHSNVTFDSVRLRC